MGQTLFRFCPERDSQLNSGADLCLGARRLTFHPHRGPYKSYQTGLERKRRLILHSHALAYLCTRLTDPATTAYNMSSTIAVFGATGAQVNFTCGRANERSMLSTPQCTCPCPYVRQAMCEQSERYLLTRL
jgi:hypothetical protein